MDRLSDSAAERGVLSLIIKHGKDAYLEVADSIKSTTFDLHLNQNLYAVLSHILTTDLEKKIDLAVILSTAKDLGISEQLLSDSQYLNKVINFHTDLSNLKGFARKIRILEITREIIGKYSDAQEDLKSVTGSETISEIIAKAENPIFELINGLVEKGGVRHITTGLDDYIEHLKTMENLDGVDCGFPVYQKLIGGIRIGTHLVSARKKTGKSFLAMNAAMNAAKKGVKVLLLDSEMDLDSGLWNRLLSRASGVPLSDIMYGYFKNNEVKVNKIDRANEKLKSIPLYYENIANRQFEEVLSLIKRWLLQVVGYDSRGNINQCLVVYDWLKLTNSSDLKTATEWQLLGFRTTNLNDLALKYKFPLLLFTQQNREMDIAASDRLSWFCSSCTSLMKKTQDEINTDGIECGNLKMIVTDSRHAEGSDYGDYINVHLNGKVATMTELGLNSVMQKMREIEEPEGE